MNAILVVLTLALGPGDAVDGSRSRLPTALSSIESSGHQLAYEALRAALADCSDEEWELLDNPLLDYSLQAYSKEVERIYRRYEDLSARAVDAGHADALSTERDGYVKSQADYLLLWVFHEERLARELGYSVWLRTEVPLVTELTLDADAFRERGLEPSADWRPGKTRVRFRGITGSPLEHGLVDISLHRSREDTRRALLDVGSVLTGSFTIPAETVVPPAAGEVYIRRPAGAETPSMARFARANVVVKLSGVGGAYRDLQSWLDSLIDRAMENSGEPESALTPPRLLISGDLRVPSSAARVKPRPVIPPRPDDDDVLLVPGCPKFVPGYRAGHFVVHLSDYGGCVGHDLGRYGSPARSGVN